MYAEKSCDGLFWGIIRDLDGINEGNHEMFTTVMSGMKFK
jgi:hypothetical protein